MSGALGPGTYLLGALQLGFTLGCAATAALALLRRTALTGLPRLVGWALLTALGVILAELLPLLFGVLTRGSVLIAAALVALVAHLIARRAPVRVDVDPVQVHVDPVQVHVHPVPASVAPASEAGGRTFWPSESLGLVALLITAAFWLGALEVLATQHVASVDALSFHLPGVIRYLQSGTLWQLTQYLPGQAQANYPQYGDLLLLAAVLPWHSLALVRYVDPVMLALAVAAAYAAARELGAPRPTAAIVVLALFSLRPALSPALPDDLTDPTFLAGFAAGLLFLLRYRRTGATAELLLAGAGLGLALGTKWYGLEDVPLLVLAWAAIVRPGWRVFLTLVVTVAVCGGVWLIRNWVLTRDPIFDEPVRLLGVTIFAAPYSTIQHQIGFSLAHYLTRFGVLRRYVWPVFRGDFGLAGLIVALAALAGPLMRRRDPRGWALLAGAVLCLVAYLVTPYTALGYDGAPVLVAANTRYLVPALLLGAPLAALAIARLGRARAVAELALVVLTVIELHRQLWFGGGRLLVSAILVAAAVALLWGARRAGRMPRTRPTRTHPTRTRPLRTRPKRTPPTRTRAPLLPAAAVLLALACVAIAYHYQRVLAVTPYEPGDPTVDYVLARYPAHTRIGITGTWDTGGTIVPGPLFGPRLQNQVGYVGRFVDHRLAQYATEARFVAALRRDRYPLLEVGDGDPPQTRPPQVRWAQAAGYRVVASSPRLTLLRASGGP